APEGGNLPPPGPLGNEPAAGRYSFSAFESSEDFKRNCKAVQIVRAPRGTGTVSFPPRPREHLRVEFPRLAPRHREVVPVVGGQVLGQEDDLASVIRLVRELAVDRPPHAVGLGADEDRPR